MSFGSSVEHYAISKNHPKMAAILYQILSFTLLFHFDNAKFLKDTNQWNQQNAHHMRCQTPSQRNYFKPSLHSDLTQKCRYLQLCKGRLKMRQHSIRLPYGNPKSISTKWVDFQRLLPDCCHPRAAAVRHASNKGRLPCLLIKSTSLHVG